MADWSDPTNFQLETLLEALLFAYPTHQIFHPLKRRHVKSGPVIAFRPVSFCCYVGPTDAGLCAINPPGRSGRRP
jgi:hypothetical protein